jgi:hypothetical protein
MTDEDSEYMTEASMLRISETLAIGRTNRGRVLFLDPTSGLMLTVEEVQKNHSLISIISGAADAIRASGDAEHADVLKDAAKRLSVALGD